jgi:hypothetical protein
MLVAGQSIMQIAAQLRGPAPVPWWRNVHQDKLGGGMLFHIEKLSHLRTEVVSGHYPLQLMNVRYREVGTSGRTSWMGAERTSNSGRSRTAALKRATGPSRRSFMEIADCSLQPVIVILACYLGQSSCFVAIWLFRDCLVRTPLRRGRTRAVLLLHL